MLFLFKQPGKQLDEIADLGDHWELRLVKEREMRRH